MTNFEHENIEPFNDVYYCGCDSLIYFTAIKYLGGNIFSYMANDIFTYVHENNKPCPSIALKNTPIKPLYEINEINNICLERINIGSNNLVDVIKDILLNGSIVIVPADGFYYRHPYHDLFYQRVHHDQSFLIYGFNTVNETFKIVDVNGFEWNTENCCYKNEIDFKELQSCYENILSNGLLLPIQKLSKKESSNMINYQPHLYRELLIENIINNKSVILEGLEKIKNLTNKTSINISKTECFNNKVASISNMYRTSKIIGHNEDEIYFLKEIHNRWIYIEHLVYKYEMKKRSEDQKIEVLSQIFDLEAIYYTNFFSKYGG
ncbi:MAG: hypothetical protein FWG91_00745 [Lachnospiraceae bacterium]|nr:hypothetical protein [Lachnospiraceae bacterium]